MKASSRYPTFALLLIGSVALVWWGFSYLLVIDSDRKVITTDTPNAATHTVSQSTSDQSQITRERVIYRGDPPYLTELPILDGNLFVNHSGDFLLFGGANIEQVRFSAGTGTGNRASVDFRENAIAFLMTEQPYVEFTYQGKFYSLQILSRAYFFTMEFRELPLPSIELTEQIRDSPRF